MKEQKNEPVRAEVNEYRPKRRNDADLKPALREAAVSCGRAAAKYAWLIRSLL